MKSKTLLILLGLTASIFLQSCQTVDKEQVKETVINFFSAYRDNDFLQVSSIYPNIVNLKGQFRKSSSIDIELKDISVVNDSNIIVDITHHWVNPWGVDNTAKMKLYVAKQGETYKILDTKNFCMYDNMKLYNFACKTGAINLRRDTTDVSISAKMSDVTPMYALAKTVTKHEITNSLSINKGWKWETGYYADYASGRAVVTNNSPFPIKQPKYKITYYKSDDKTVVTTDEGIVCYDILMPGQSKSFSWYTSYVGNAARAKVTVVCDNEEWIEDIISNFPFNGLEYEKYNKNIDWWPFRK
jgi:hypothetical protein